MSTVVESYRGNMRLLETFSSGPGRRKHGEFYAYHPNGTRAMSGSYLHGKPNGIWKRWYDNGILASVHYYAFGALNGPYVQYFDNGNKAREGLYRRGIPDGTHRIYYRDNQTEQSLFTIVDSKLTRFRVMLKGVELLYDEDLGLTQNGSTLRPSKVCFLRGNGTLVCKTLGQMVADLSTVINPEDLSDIISALDSLYDLADLGLDPGNDILVGCADSVQAVASIDGASADISEFGYDGAPLRRAPMTEPEVNEIIQRCRQSAWGQQGLDTGSPDFDSQRDSFVEDTVAQIDEEIGNCREPSNQSLQDGWDAAGSIIGSGIEGAATVYSGHEQAEALKASAMIQASVDEEGYKLPSNSDDNPTVQQHKENEGQEKRTYKDGWEVVTGQPVDKRIGEPGTTKDTTSWPGTWLAGPWPMWREAGSVVVFRNTEGDMVATETMDSDFNKSPRQYYDPETGAPIAPTMEFTEEEVEEALGDGSGDGSGDGPSGTTPGVGMPEGPDSMSRCQQAAAAWAALKAHCDASQWQTYECAQVLRTFNGCVDLALITPGPEGDVTCLRRKDMTPGEAAAAECERKKGIMSFSGFETITCRSDFDVTRPKKDMCSDPHIMCLPDQMVREEHGGPEPPRPGALPQPERGTGPGPVERRGPGPVERRAISRAPSADAANPMANWAPPADVRFPGLTDEAFDDHLAKMAKPTLVVFGAASCPPCKRVQRNLQGITDQFPEKVDLRYVEVPQNPRLAEKFDIRYTPTIAMFEHGNILGQRRVGAATSDLLLKWVQRCLRVRASKEKDMEEAR